MRKYLLVAGLAAVFAGIAFPANASADQTITSTGPLTDVGITSDLNCSVDHIDDSASSFYGGTACGTLVASGGTLYGPAAIPAGDSASPRTSYTPVSQTAVTGAGTAGNPYKIVTVVDLGSSNLRVTQTDTYVVGNEFYRTDVELRNNGASAATAIVYRAGDCYLADSDDGFGSHDVSTGAVACVGPVDDGNGGSIPGSRIEEFLPLTSGSHSYEAGFSTVWELIGQQQPFDDSCLCDQLIDNGAGLSWNVNVPAGQSVVRSNLITFSPTGQTAHVLDVAKDGTGSGSVTSNPAGIDCGSTCSQGFTDGTVVTLSASAAAGSTFAGWSGAGCSGTGTCVVTMSQARSVTATFNAVAVNYQLSVAKDGTGSGSVTSNPAGINCGATCQAQYQSGTVVTLSASAAAGSTFAGWSGAGCSGTGTCVVTMSQARSVTATFNAVAVNYQLSVAKDGTGSGSVTSNPAGINCGATCQAQYQSGTVVTLSASAAAGSTFAGWSGAGCSGTGTCVVTMSQARSVTATFNAVAVNYQLSVAKDGTGSGSVTSNPAGIDCGSTCSQGFTDGTVVTLSASAAAGSTFAGWSGAGCSGTGTCVVTMSQARSVTATFNAVAVNYQLSVAKDGTGSGSVTSNPAGINCGATCQAQYQSGTVVTLSASAAAGSTFAGWSGAGCSGTGTCVVTMSQARSVTATFTANPVDPPVIDPPGPVPATGLFCGVQHRGHCNGIKVKTEFSGPGNAVWQFGAYNPKPGNGSPRKSPRGAPFVKLGSLEHEISDAGAVTVKFKLKQSKKTKRLYKKVRKLKLKTLQIKVTFTSDTGEQEVSTADVKLNLGR